MRILVITDNIHTTLFSRMKKAICLEKKEFTQPCELNINTTGTFREFHDRLRSLSHGNFKNAYFISESGEKYI